MAGLAVGREFGLIEGVPRRTLKRPFCGFACCILLEEITTYALIARMSGTMPTICIARFRL
jgi:hypothetical protein